jgi:hypothetical protein
MRPGGLGASFGGWELGRGTKWEEGGEGGEGGGEGG